VVVAESPGKEPDAAPTGTDSNPARGVCGTGLVARCLPGSTPGADGVGIGVKRTAGEFLDHIALTVFVPEKLPADEVPPDRRIPPTWDAQGIEFRTDVVQSKPTPIALVNDTSFHPTLQGGIEIGSREQVDAVAVRDHEGSPPRVAWPGGLPCPWNRRTVDTRGMPTDHQEQATEPTKLGFTMETIEMVAPLVIAPSMLTTARFQAR
jgi:hypothetical protein